MIVMTRQSIDIHPPHPIGCSITLTATPNQPTTPLADVCTSAILAISFMFLPTITSLIIVQLMTEP